jgi:hypothetical protein
VDVSDATAYTVHIRTVHSTAHTDVLLPVHNLVTSTWIGAAQQADAMHMRVVAHAGSWLVTNVMMTSTQPPHYFTVKHVSVRAR